MLSLYAEVSEGTDYTRQCAQINTINYHLSLRKYSDLVIIIYSVL
jgi:hypothetical protein